MRILVAWARWFQSRPYHAAAAVFFLLVGAGFYAPYLGDLPSGIHTWAQTDRLALALNFYDYGLHFLTPRTSCLSSIGGVTGVEFPLQAYLAALGGEVFGRGSIIPLFHLLNVSMVLVGFYYLFRLIFERTGNVVAGLVPGIFLLASPTFAFYTGGFAPDPFSLSLSFVGYFYWLRFFDERRFADLRLAVVLLTVASLVKTTTALNFGGLVAITLVWAFMQPGRLLPRERWQLLGLVGAGVGLIGFFFLHNQALNEQYQSWLFKSSSNPAENVDTWHDVVINVRRYWAGEYATVAQYRTLLVCAGLFVVFAGTNWRRYLPLSLLLLSSLAAAALFVLVMGAGLGGHDYHVICAAGPPAILVLVLALLNLGRLPGRMRYLTGVGFGVLIFFLGANGYKRLHRRMSDDYPPFSPFGHLWMRGGAAEMERAGVPAAAQVLYCNEVAPNIAPVYFDRRGLVWQPASVATLVPEDFLLRMAADSLDYVVLAPADYAQLSPQHAALAAEFETVGQQPAVVLRRRSRQHSW